MDLHVWSYPRRSYIFHVSSKSVKGFWSPWGRNLPIPITLAIGFYNSLHYRASRDEAEALHLTAHMSLDRLHYCTTVQQEGQRHVFGSPFVNNLTGIAPSSLASEN